MPAWSCPVVVAGVCCGRLTPRTESGPQCGPFVGRFSLSGLEPGRLAKLGRESVGLRGSPDWFGCADRDPFFGYEVSGSSAAGRQLFCLCALRAPCPAAPQHGSLARVEARLPRAKHPAPRRPSEHAERGNGRRSTRFAWHTAAAPGRFCHPVSHGKRLPDRVGRFPLTGPARRRRPVPRRQLGLWSWLCS